MVAVLTNVDLVGEGHSLVTVHLMEALGRGGVVARQTLPHLHH